MQVSTLNGVEAVETDLQKPQLLIVEGDVELLWLAGSILAALPPLSS
jgi:hypothetical protein